MDKHRQKTTILEDSLTEPETTNIENCVTYYKTSIDDLEHVAKGLVSACESNTKLKDYIHFIKYRLKDPDHLRAKLHKKALEDKKSGGIPTINESNLFEKITDLVGVRIIHLYTDQISNMDDSIRAIFDVWKYILVETPVANIWDSESEVFFKNLGFETIHRSDTMYTSVHYVVALNATSSIRCELQVRTLADELWGEVSHMIDYPEPTKSIACKNQLKVLARFTTGCTRLVDSIFRSKAEFEELSNQTTEDAEKDYVI